ncbi:tRNA (adenine(22)-N(1))-methyltransferase [Thermobrachium celere]|uniref:Putative tRNA-m1A22 methylase n=1 Tax=Thermobrachium celere DSM 8682 TaxID=941824 RepID=R7RPF9_9CLOT|nr:class I SAM-dependent methyltransferase [Thermobrachium celere]CDF58052.1 Putative tRNA-m1A22 methylase [Thermobrachium celere DSM 8682]
MILSKRLEAVFDMIEKCNCLADIGTDHGYIPIKAIRENKCKKAIASDIKIGPIEVAKKNIKKYELSNLIEVRLGPGLSTLKNGEADVIVISGMGGNLISDIIKNDIQISKNSKYLILQPVQYPEILRQELFNLNFLIIDENIIKEDNKYYHIMKVSYGNKNEYKNQAEFYIGPVNIKKQNSTTFEYIQYKLDHLKLILNNLDRNLHKDKYDNLINLISDFEEVKKCLLK